MANVIVAFRNFAVAPNNGAHTCRLSLKPVLLPRKNHRAKIQHERVKKEICFFFILFLLEAQTCFAFTGELEGKRVSDLHVAERYRTVTGGGKYYDSCQIK